MRLSPLFPLFVTAAVIAVIAYDRLGSQRNNSTSSHVLYSQELHQSESTPDDESRLDDYRAQSQVQSIQQLDTELLLDIEGYEDADYGFSVAIPSGWQKIVAAESEDNIFELEPGYAVGFESPYQGEHDKFADYVLIEVLPGKDSGLFETDGKSRRKISINGQSAWMDRLDVKGESGGLTEVDLTIFQTEVSGLGYTIGLYAIGEPSREKLMADAFEVIVRTFRQTSSPFPTS
jgi:hypothetical protein